MRKKFLLRINSDLWEELSRWADDEFRSVNGQIEYLLRREVERRKRSKQQPPEEQEKKVE